MGSRVQPAIPNSRENTNHEVEEVEKEREFSYYFFNLFDLAVKFLLIFSSFGISGVQRGFLDFLRHISNTVIYRRK
jgi:hypothetical protein